MIPIVAPIAAGRDGETYNINADTMAGAIAAALGAARLFLLTDVPGVLDKQGELLTDLTPADIARLTADGTISGGMIPKLETCVHAVEAGCEAAVVLDGRVGHAMLLEFFTSRGAGTLVRAGVSANRARRSAAALLLAGLRRATSSRRRQPANAPRTLAHAAPLPPQAADFPALAEQGLRRGRRSSTSRRSAAANGPRPRWCGTIR